MIYVMCVLVFFLICLLIKEPKNKYTYFFVLMTLGLVVMIFTSLTLWKYDYPNIWLFRMDYKIILKISTSYWKYYDMLDAFNYAMVVYMLSVQLFVYNLNKNIDGIKKYIPKVIFLIFCVIYLWFYDSETALQIYFKINTEKGSELYITIFNCIMVAVQTIYILYPSLKLLIYTKYEEFWPKRRQMLTFGTYIFTVSIFVICFFVFGSLKNNYLDMSPAMLLGMREYFRINTYQYIILVVLLCTFVLGTLFIIFRTKVLFTSATIRRKIFKNRWTIDTETREIFHMFKNILFNIEAAANQALMTADAREKDKRLKSISDLCEKRISEFFSITAVSKKADYSINPVQTYEIIEEALKRVPVGKDIKIVYEYLADEGLIYADNISMTEAIQNILKNAVESFESSNCEDKVIKIKVRNDQDMVAIDISDNGKGIRKRDLKRVFKPLYTTKNRINNWGVGLAFAYKTIIAHCGHIKISSVEGQGTCVSIILYRQEAYRLWKR